MVDKISTAYAGINNNDLENRIIDSMNVSPNVYPLYPKLSGFFGEASVPMDSTLVGVDNPFELSSLAIKDTIGALITNSNTDSNIPPEVDKQWVLMGAEFDTRRIPSMTYVNDRDTANSNGFKRERWGFNLDTSYGYTDNTGTRVKVIGSSDKRWRNRPIIGTLKSNDIAAPTNIYWPFTFRIFQGVRPEMPNQNSICLYTRELHDVLSLCGFKLTLDNNTTDLYSKITSNVQRNS